MAYQRYTTFPAGTIFAAMDAKQKRMPVEGTSISCGMTSLRMRVFRTHGAVCAHCGETGTYFAVERPEFSADERQWHLNLYSEAGVMLTFDHVHPKSHGGANTLDNAQTLCYPCNQKKADTV